MNPDIKLVQKHYDDEPERYNVLSKQGDPMGQVWFNPKNNKWGVSLYDMPWYVPVKRTYFPSKEGAIQYIVAQNMATPKVAHRYLEKHASRNVTAAKIDVLPPLESSSEYQQFVFFDMGNVTDDIPLENLTGLESELTNKSKQYLNTLAQKEDFGTPFMNGPLIRVVQWGSKIMAFGYLLGYTKKRKIIRPR